MHDLCSIVLTLPLTTLALTDEKPTKATRASSQLG